MLIKYSEKALHLIALQLGKEEVCIWVWYNQEEDEIEIIPFEDGSTELDHNLIY